MSTTHNITTNGTVGNSAIDHDAAPWWRDMMATPEPRIVAAGSTEQQGRALRKLCRALVATGTAINSLVAAPRKKAPQQKCRRLLYRRSLTDSDLDALVREIGIDRVWAAAERATQPQSLVAAE